MSSNDGGFFDLESPRAFFAILRMAYKDLSSAKVKRTRDLIFVVMGLNHLRDWIAPGYGKQHNWLVPTTAAQHFHHDIWGVAEFKTLNELCNRSKHMQPMEFQLTSDRCSNVFDWPSVFEVTDIFKGPPTEYFVDGRNVMEIIQIVIQYYDEKWFSRADLQA